jgi:hypothetical protein
VRRRRAPPECWHQDASAEDDGYGISWAVRVPRDAETGPAMLRAGGAELPVEVVRDR